jgi:hypothetical protein
VALERHGRWGRAIGVPGLAALNRGEVGVTSVSCVRAGYCAAGGRYADGSAADHGFVAVERNGVWGRAIQVPGLAGLNKDGFGWVTSVSCGAAGSCTAGGFYSDGGQSGFVAVERNGVWGRAIQVPGLAALNGYGDAQVNSVSCGAAGSCAAGGSYGGGGLQAFVAVERNGVWGRAIEVPGLAALSSLGFAQVTSVSCGAAGSCAAGGYYVDRHNDWQGLVALERNGRWGRASYVPGLAALNKGGTARVTSVSCAPAGGCVAGGYYVDRHRNDQGFVAVERNGRWGRASYVPGLPALDKGGSAGVSAVSCGPEGGCAAGGAYTDRRGHQQAFAVVEQNGRWGRASYVPGLPALNKGGYAGVDSVSCTSAGSCMAGGFYAPARPPPAGASIEQGFVAAEKNGRWGRPIQMPRPGA